ncbi:LuxR C-terminal-related transcriptional regulator [Pseudomonas sp. GD03858]|uniref:helix-turn-helix transcriptional regulator n=1 Tax=unclassified Pseudomonas TaxID=196821 RepID=UPI002449B2C1|nr:MULTISPECIES: helix-turn-helix transcriptional regulator [unclassified Pseudomonas]MDH0649765.1 LuxR C-terminal-related transcriptional regulator [Pseudomonas sp. GD03867]MDH0665418.1 LuxR C-terminal-related transcriptional regulator [Pseudomonas sp. GD03858]
MKLTDSLAQHHAPHLYLQLGELIASSGDDDFAGQMFKLVDALVPIHQLTLSEWTLDSRQARVERIVPLGFAGTGEPSAPRDDPPDTLLQSILQMDDPVLVQTRRPLGRRYQAQSAYQCSLVSCSGERRWLIGCHRLLQQRAFTLAELSLLKSLSDTLLPLVEHHALRQPVRQRAFCAQLMPVLSPGSLRAAFGERLAQGAISLSAREQEVCLGLLTGGTVPQMAQRLNVKNSSVETYLKRATAKLGVSGRHGLARWMAGA